MRIAVTGGGGQIGRAVCELAVGQGHTVVDVDLAGTPGRPGGDAGWRRVAADATVHQELAGAIEGCEALVHLAAHPSPEDHPDHVVHNDNVVASYNALSAATGAGIARICLASSVNAIGAVFSRRSRYDYFPIDEEHPTYNEDPYSLSKWICEIQADSFARRYEHLAIASLRLHGVLRDPAAVDRRESRAALTAAQLWGYTSLEAAARACLLAVTAGFRGHERFFIVAPDTVSDVPSPRLAATFHPGVPMRTPITGHQGFFDCGKAERLLGWRHDKQSR